MPPELLPHLFTRYYQATAGQAQLFVDASEDIRRLLHQFAAGFLKEPDARLVRTWQHHRRGFANYTELDSIDGENPARRTATRSRARGTAGATCATP